MRVYFDALTSVSVAANNLDDALKSLGWPIDYQSVRSATTTATG